MAGDPVIAGISLKCKIYGDQPHDPCSGIDDSGAERPCACWCHKEAKPHEPASN